jgi:hypothetical protein
MENQFEVKFRELSEELFVMDETQGMFLKPDKKRANLKHKINHSVERGLLDDKYVDGVFDMLEPFLEHENLIISVGDIYKFNGTVSYIDNYHSILEIKAHLENAGVVILSDIIHSSKNEEILFRSDFK